MQKAQIVNARKCLVCLDNHVDFTVISISGGYIL